MNSHTAQSEIGALDRLCLRIIAFYQRHLSPRKGYRCAHARLHGGTGCSGFAREAIERHGLRAATPQIRARFGACQWAARTLRAGVDLDKRDEPARKKPESSGGGTDHALCNAAALLPDGICCLGEAALNGAACEGLGCAEAACGCLPCL